MDNPPPPILKQGVLLNIFESYPEHLQPPALKRRRVLIRNTPPSTEDLLTQSEHRTPESKGVKAHTLMFRVYPMFYLIISKQSSTELIKTIINRNAIIKIKYKTTKMIPKQDFMRQKLSRLAVFSHI